MAKDEKQNPKTEKAEKPETPSVQPQAATEKKEGDASGNNEQQGARRASPGRRTGRQDSGGGAGAGDDRRKGRGGGGGGRSSSSRRGGRRSTSTEESELIERTISNNRVSKVVKGGRRFSVSTLVVVGNGSGRVGFGTGKARETSEATRKALAKAQKNMIEVPLRNGTTIYHDVTGHFGSGRVVLRSARSGTGIIAGGPMRAVFEVLGIEDVVAKSIGSSNPHNMVRATFHALKRTHSPRSVAARRQIDIKRLVPPPTAKTDKKVPAQKKQPTAKQEAKTT